MFLKFVVGVLDQDAVEEVEFLDAVRADAVLTELEWSSAVKTFAVGEGIGKAVKKSWYYAEKTHFCMISSAKVVNLFRLTK